MSEAKTESKVVQDAVAAGMDPEVAKQMEAAGELTPTEGEEAPVVTPPAEKTEPEHIEKKADGEEGATAGDEPAATVTTPEAGKGKEGEGEEGEGPNRTEKFVPAWKAKEMAKKAAEEAGAAIRAELETEFAKKAAELGGKKGGASSEDVQAFATEFNLEPDAAASMIDRMSGLIENRLGIGDLKKTVETQQAEKIKQDEIQGFETEWTGKETQAALETAAKAAGQTITPELKNRVYELAYSTTYAKYRLPDIIALEASKLFVKAPAAAPTAEAGRGGSGTGAAAKSIDQMSKDEMASLSDEEFMRLSDDLGKSGSRIPISKGKK